jgi:hypothetical protein
MALYNTIYGELKNLIVLKKVVFTCIQWVVKKIKNEEKNLS